MFPSNKNIAFNPITGTHPGGGAGLPHLHPIILPLVPCPFQGGYPIPGQGGTPSWNTPRPDLAGEGAGMGVPPSQGWVTPPPSGIGKHRK